MTAKHRWLVSSVHGELEAKESLLEGILMRSIPEGPASFAESQLMK